MEKEKITIDRLKIDTAVGEAINKALDYGFYTGVEHSIEVVKDIYAEEDYHPFVARIIEELEKLKNNKE